MTYTIIDLSQSPAPDLSLDPTRLKEQIAKAYGIAVIIVLQQADYRAFEVITAVLQESFVHQVILVDNGNDEAVRESLSKLRHMSQKVMVIKREKTTHQGAALNEASEEVRHPYVLVLDQHYKLMDNGTWRLLLSAQTMKGDWVIGVKRQSKNKTDMPSCTYLPTPLEACKQILGRGLTVPMSVARTTPLQPYYVPAANAACVFMPSHLLGFLGGWDPHTTIWGGYSDFCLRVHQSKGNVYYLPEVVVTEWGHRSLSWRYQLDSARGVMSYMTNHYAHTSRLIRWPLAAVLGVCCFLAPYMASFKAKWHRRRSD